MISNLPKSITVTAENAGSHLQGIALDRANGHFYWSFTTCLVKTDLNGNIIGSVSGLVGHLGCIAFCKENGRVYGSLEFKRDSIGRSIAERVGLSNEVKDGFYIVSFDTKKIVRKDMNAEKDGVMNATFLREVYDDYTADGHRYGCSGIDGVTFAPSIGTSEEKNYLYVAYGIYGDNSRADNDNQIILKYDVDTLDRFSAPLDQNDMHRNGPASPDAKYFVSTGNTRYGIQNLEYDESSHTVIAAVYKGDKKNYPNFSTFFISADTPPTEKVPLGLTGKHDVLALTNFEKASYRDTSLGSHFPLGSTGIISLGDGDFYFAEAHSENGKSSGTAELYSLDKSDVTFRKI